MSPFYNKSMLVAEATLDIGATMMVVRYMQIGLATQYNDWVSWACAIVTGLVVMSFMFENTTAAFDRRARNY